MRDCEGLHEKLSLYEKGELSTEEERTVRDHLEACPSCRATLAQLETLSALCLADELLPAGEATTAATLDSIRSALSAEGLLADHPHEIMTLEETARFLRVSQEDLAQELHALPLFEFAGKLRIRRSRLIEWIEERERQGRARRTLTLVSRS